jgi:hypothetical protein
MREKSSGVRTRADGRVEYLCSACGAYRATNLFAKRDSRRGFVCRACSEQNHPAKGVKLFLDKYVQTNKPPSGAAFLHMLQGAPLGLISDNDDEKNRKSTSVYRRIINVGSRGNRVFMQRVRAPLFESIALKCFTPIDAIWLAFRPGFMDDTSALLWAMGYGLYAAKITRLDQEVDVSLVFGAVRTAALSGAKSELVVAARVAHDIYVQSEKPAFSPAARRVALALTAFEREPEDAAYAVISGCAEGLVLLGRSEEGELVSIFDILLVVARDAAAALKVERQEHTRLVAKLFEQAEKEDEEEEI